MKHTSKNIVFILLTLTIILTLYRTVRSEDQTLWSCSMHPQVIQDKPGTCPICHMKLTPLNGGAPQHEHKDGRSDDNRQIKYWWDPMLTPPYISDKPGKSPMGMDLIPVYEDEVNSTGSQVTIDPAIVQNMGIRTAHASYGSISNTIRLFGSLDEAQPNIREINLRVSGWIKHLYANTEGMYVKAGEPLFELYSPDLQVAVQELIGARRIDSNSTGKLTKEMHATSLYETSVKKLELLGLDRRQIQLLAKLEQAPEVIAIFSPISGHITEKAIVEGSAVKSGDRLFRIVDHSLLWLDVQAFEKDIPKIQLGQKATAAISAFPNASAEGEVIFIHPHLDMISRTVLVRLAVPNPLLKLKPGMYATARIEVEINKHALLIPKEAVIDTGTRQIVFVALDAGSFEPHEVKVGTISNDNQVEILEGLKVGDTVVTSGQFLLDSESRIQEAIQKFLSQKQQADQHKGKTDAATVGVTQ